MLRFYTMTNAPAKQPGHIASSRSERRRAWLVHAYTGLGAVLAFIAAWGVTRFIGMPFGPNSVVCSD